MDRFQARIKNLYQYKYIVHETQEGIILRIQKDHRNPDKLASIYFLKEDIDLMRSSKDVLIPEWLCIKTGLIKDNQEEA